MNAIRRLAAASATALSIGFATPPSLAQVVVFDPNNYAAKRADGRSRAAADQ